MNRLMNTKKHAVHEDQVLNDHPVALGDGLDQRLAQTGNAEGPLHGHGPAYEAGKLDSRHRYDGQQGVAENVTPNHRPLAESFGPRRPHVVLAEHLQERGATHPRYQGGQAQPHGQGRTHSQGHVGHRIVPDVHDLQRGPPREVEDRDQDDDEAQPEAGYSQEQSHDEAGRVVTQRVAPHCAYHADRQTDDPRKDDGHDGYLERDRPPAFDDPAYGGVGPEGLSHVAPGYVADPAEVLNG